MKRASVALVVGLLVLGIGATSAVAQGFGPGRFGPGGGGLGGFPFMLRNLNLTDAQKGQIRQIMATYRPQFQALRQQAMDAQKQLTDKLYDSTSTADQLAALAAQASQVRAQMAQLRTRMALDVRNVLTPDQLAKAAQTHQRLSELRAEMRALLAPAP